MRIFIFLYSNSDYNTKIGIKHSVKRLPKKNFQTPSSKKISTQIAPPPSPKKKFPLSIMAEKKFPPCFHPQI